MKFTIFPISIGVPRIFPYPNGLKIKLTWPHTTCGYLDLIFELFRKLVSGVKGVGSYFSLLTVPAVDSRMRVNLLLLFDIKGHALVKASPHAKKYESISIKSRYEFKYRDLVKGQMPKHLMDDILAKSNKDLMKQIGELDPNSVILFRFTTIVTDISIKVVKKRSKK